jgi:DNA segregation ATPase FtsK/SpoIIIE-like protein
MPRIGVLSAKSLPAKAGMILLFLALLLPSSSLAQDDFGDPPTRVARLSFIRGSVSFQPAGTDDWIDATWNRPVTTGDTLWSDRGSRAALHIGSASIVLSENTGFSFLNLTDSIAQLQLTVGTLRLRVKRLGDNETFEVDTPNLAFSVLRPGIYKISVNEAGDTTVVEDRSGEGEVTGGGSAYTVHSGELDTFTGTDPLSAETDSIYDNDDEFEQWCEQRDHHEDNSVSVRYVSEDVIGYDDLDDGGGWRPVPEYGYVWFPHTTIVGWAPYHYGHWAYIAPWGYTWVDDASWGFAPFHYGRWVYVGGAWGWVPCPPRPAAYSPGAVYVSPVYAPALVAWIGLGGGGSIGWFPLGPREVYVPSYPVSRNYVTNVNVSNTTVNTTVINNYYNTVIVNKTVNVTNVTYVNQRVQGAVVATTPQAFSSGQPVAKNVVTVNAREVASAPVTVTTPPSVPQRAAVLGGRAAATVKPPAAIQSRTVVAKTPPPPRPPSFTERQTAIQANGGKPLSAAQVRQIAPARTQGTSAPQVKVAPPSKPAEMRSAQTKAPVENNTNRPTAPAATSNRPPNAAPAPKENNRPTSPPATANASHPPTAHPQDEQIEQKHQQQIADLHKKQDEEREQVERQQEQERQKLQEQQADEAKQKQLTQQHQQQLEQLQQKHQQEQQQLQQKQQQEHREAQKPQPANPQPQPKPKTDRPPANPQ